MTPVYCARKRFGPKDGDAWAKYITWSKLTQLRELVSLDGMLCEEAPEFKDEYWPHVADIQDITNRGFFYSNLPFLERSMKADPNFRILAALPNPSETPPVVLNDGFTLLGFDMIERDGTVSALCNCGGFPESFDNMELSDIGLIQSYERAAKIQRSLFENNPQEPHADCNMWALYSRVEQ